MADRYGARPKSRPFQRGLGIEFVDKSTCLTLQKKEVPLNQLKSYTRQTIPKEAILFVTRKGKELCADPEKPWVKKAVDALNDRAKSQLDSKKAANTKKTAVKNKRGKPKNKRNSKKNARQVSKVKATSTVNATAQSSIMKS